MASHPEPTPEEEAQLRRLAREVLPGRLAHYEARMGVCPTGMRITGARTRFGSCSGKNSICFSWRLMAYPQEAVDYVVVHELAHRKEMNHSRKFWAEVKNVLPDYEKRRKWLKEFGGYV